MIQEAILSHVDCGTQILGAYSVIETPFSPPSPRCPYFLPSPATTDEVCSLTLRGIAGVCDLSAFLQAEGWATPKVLRLKREVVLATCCTYTQMPPLFCSLLFHFPVSGWWMSPTERRLQVSWCRFWTQNPDDVRQALGISFLCFFPVSPACVYVCVCVVCGRHRPASNHHQDSFLPTTVYPHM